MASADLRKLWKLHLIDAAITEIRARAATLDTGKSIQAEIDVLSKQISTNPAKLLMGEQQDLEFQQKSIDDKIAKFEKDLYGGKIVNAREVSTIEIVVADAVIRVSQDFDQQTFAQVVAARAGLAQAEAEERDADAQHRRNVELVGKGFVSRSALDASRARAERAVAGVGSARAALAAAEAGARNAHVAVDYTMIRAPFDGVILSKSANVGDMVTPFSSATDSKGAVVTMADMDTLEVEADVSESSLSKVKVGQPAEILLDALPDSRFLGHISRMVPTVDRAKATVMTKVRFDRVDPRVLPEMSAKVSFLSQEMTPGEQKPLTAVSADAVVQRDGASVVFVVRDGVATAVPVKTGAKLGDLLAVDGEISSGEKAVLRPAAGLATGTRVRAAGR